MNFNKYNIENLLHTVLYVTKVAKDRSYTYVSKLLYICQVEELKRAAVNCIDDHFIVKDGIPRSVMLDIALTQLEVPEELHILGDSIKLVDGDLETSMEPDLDYISEFSKEVIDKMSEDADSINNFVCHFDNGRVINPVDIVTDLNEDKEFIDFVKERYAIDMFLNQY